MLVIEGSVILARMAVLSIRGALYKNAELI